MCRCVCSCKNPTELGWLSMCPCSLFAKTCSHYSQDPAMRWWYLCVDEAHGLLGVPVAHWGDHQVMYPQKLLSRLSDGPCKATSSIHQSLMFHSEPWLLFSHHFTAYQSCSLQLSNLDGVREKWTILAESCITGGAKHLLTYSYFHWWVEKVSCDVELGHLGGGVMRT